MNGKISQGPLLDEELQAFSGLPRDNLPDSLSGSKWSVLNTPPHKLTNEVVFSVGRAWEGLGARNDVNTIFIDAILTKI